MKNVFFILLFAVSTAMAQKTSVEQTVTTLPSDVQTRTYEQGRSTVTEKVTTSRVVEKSVATPIPQHFKTAIFISNRAGATLDPAMASFEDLVTGRVTDLGFDVLSKEISIDSLRKFDPVLASTQRPADSLEARLVDQSSALRIAQGLGADYLLVASIVSVGSAQRAVDAYGLKKAYVDTILRFSYKVVDGQTGATITADTGKAVYTVGQGAHGTQQSTDAINAVLDEAAAKISSSLRAKIHSDLVTAPSASAPLATIHLLVEVADLYIPDVRVTPEHVVSIGSTPHKVTPLNVTVEIDGVAVGTAPGALQVKPGFARLRLTRAGFVPWERLINVSDGLSLQIAMTMTPDALARFKENTAFFNQLRSGTKLTDAEVKVLEGKATMLEHSSFKVDTKENFRFILPASYREVEN